MISGFCSCGPSDCYRDLGDQSVCRRVFEHRSKRAAWDEANGARYVVDVFSTRLERSRWWRRRRPTTYSWRCGFSRSRRGAIELAVDVHIWPSEKVYVIDRATHRFVFARFGEASKESRERRVA